MEYIDRLLRSYGIQGEASIFLTYAIMVLILFLICFITNIILSKFVLKLITKIISNNKHQWDEVLLKRKVIQRILMIVPAIIIYITAPVFGQAQEIIRRSATTYILIILVLVISSILDTINDIYRTHPISNVRPIKGLLQVVKIIMFILIGIIIIANLMGEKPLILLSGISALAAVFSFVFKDSILGFIAGIQLTSNDMLRIGDYIEMNKYGVDGDVVDITLNTVKVQNFDKSIVTIPAYALVSDSFKNWRGMKEAGGRRIKRSIYIDMNSISFCSPEMLNKYKEIKYLKNYIIQKESEIASYNQERVNDVSNQINGRRLTNIGTFRAYITYYLKNHPEINQNMSLMVRQLPPGENGLPLEIYAFTKSTEWGYYEEVQSDIFDHILSIIGEFDLRLFQNPSGHDIKEVVFSKSTNSNG